jgi:hypothetical protein
MSHDRNLRYLINRRIIYRRFPINDKPTQIFEWGSYYENGTYECYELFRSKAKINTYRSLKWHMLVMWYLNPQLDQDKLEYLCRYICDKSNNFVTFEISEHILKTILYDVSMHDLESPPKNKPRKIIFKDTCQLTTEEKLQIVGQIIGRKKLSESEIYDAMLYTHDEGDKITVEKLAKYLGCSTRTVYRNMGNELKKEKELLNQELCGTN